MCVCEYTYIPAYVYMYTYGVATISSLLKMIGLFCKRAYQRDDILQKRPIIVRGLLIVATPYTQMEHILYVTIHNKLTAI